MSPAVVTGGFAGVALVVLVFGAVCGLVGAVAGALLATRRRPARPRHRRGDDLPDAPPLIVAAPTDPLRDLYRPRPR
ncbi:hypothetical protein [Actinomadura violacea]|uniref:Uncharacterized protein n=1 Tax=Actinomadura violacea TaxID=2819934 RepID=A0ABS3S7K2_9ACTN|nr:hypothetical protein [Actinomadura violacea]MBO2464200.1 hypothetical protein [Actinomadura violacea]